MKRLIWIALVLNLCTFLMLLLSGCASTHQTLRVQSLSTMERPADGMVVASYELTVQ